MNIAQQLQKLLASANISRSKFAREIGVHTSTVSNWLDGKDVKAENLEAICLYFNCSLDYLTGKISKTEKVPTRIEKDRHNAVQNELTDFQFALYGEMRELDDEDVEELLRDARRMKELRELRKNRGKNEQ